MSQYGFTNRASNEVMYGLDKPTGGYFWQELDEKGELICHSQGLSLTDLLDYLDTNYDGLIPLAGLIKDFLDEADPTPLQINVGKMFGTDIMRKLEHVKEDVNNQIDAYAHGETIRTPNKI